MAPGVDRAAESGVDALDGVGTWYEGVKAPVAGLASPRWSGSTVRPCRSGAPRGYGKGRPFLLTGLRARVSSWPPLRLAWLRRERGSVAVVSPCRSPRPRTGFGGGAVMGRCIGLDVHR